MNSGPGSSFSDRRGLTGIQLVGAVVGLALVALIFMPGRTAEEQPTA